MENKKAKIDAIRFSNKRVFTLTHEVKISADTLCRWSWQYGRKQKTATATPIFVSSKSPGNGFRNMLPIMEDTLRNTISKSIEPPKSAHTVTKFLNNLANKLE